MLSDPTHETRLRTSERIRTETAARETTNAWHVTGVYREALDRCRHIVAECFGLAAGESHKISISILRETDGRMRPCLNVDLKHKFTDTLGMDVGLEVMFAHVTDEVRRKQIEAGHNGTAAMRSHAHTDLQRLARIPLNISIW